jgi:hypothetical protein
LSKSKESYITKEPGGGIVFHAVGVYGLVFSVWVEPRQGFETLRKEAVSL